MPSDYPFIQAVVGDAIYLAQGFDLLPPTFHSFRPAGLQYHPFCDDFGPMNLGSIVQFVEQLDCETAKHSATARIVYCVDPGRRELTNAAFLLGCYMMLRLDMRSSDVADCFDWLDDGLVEHYRDATHSAADFRLTLEDCWLVLERGGPSAGSA